MTGSARDSAVGGFSPVSKPTARPDQFAGPVTVPSIDKASVGIMRTAISLMYNLYPIGMLVIDVFLSTGGIAAGFNKTSGLSFWTLIVYILGSLALSGAQIALIDMYKHYRNVQKSGREVDVMFRWFLLGAIVVWFFDNAIDLMGYTYSTTGNRDWAMHIFPPTSEQSVGWWVLFGFLWLCGTMSEFAMTFRVKSGSRF